MLLRNIFIKSELQHIYIKSLKEKYTNLYVEWEEKS